MNNRTPTTAQDADESQPGAPDGYNLHRYIACDTGILVETNLSCEQRPIYIEPPAKRVHRASPRRSR